MARLVTEWRSVRRSGVPTRPGRREHHSAASRRYLGPYVDGIRLRSKTCRPIFWSRMCAFPCPRRKSLSCDWERRVRAVSQILSHGAAGRSKETLPQQLSVRSASSEFRTRLMSCRPCLHSLMQSSFGVDSLVMAQTAPDGHIPPMLLSARLGVLGPQSRLAGEPQTMRTEDQCPVRNEDQGPRTSLKRLQRSNRFCGSKMAVDGSRWQFLGRSPIRLAPRRATTNFLAGECIGALA